jgi:hypothetical protein
MHSHRSETALETPLNGGKQSETFDCYNRHLHLVISMLIIGACELSLVLDALCHLLYSFPNWYHYMLDGRRQVYSARAVKGKPQ